MDTGATSSHVRRPTLLPSGASCAFLNCSAQQSLLMTSRPPPPTPGVGGWGQEACTSLYIRPSRPEKASAGTFDAHPPGPNMFTLMPHNPFRFCEATSSHVRRPTLLPSGASCAFLNCSAQQSLLMTSRPPPPTQTGLPRPRFLSICTFRTWSGGKGTLSM